MAVLVKRGRSNEVMGIGSGKGRKAWVVREMTLMDKREERRKGGKEGGRKGQGGKRMERLRYVGVLGDDVNGKEEGEWEGRERQVRRGQRRTRQRMENEVE